MNRRCAHPAAIRDIVPDRQGGEATPLGVRHPDDYSIRLAKAVAAVSTYPYPPVNIGCMYTGGFTDWADEKGIAALDVELTDHTHTDYDMNLKVLETFLNWKR